MYCTCSVGKWKQNTDNGVTDNYKPDIHCVTCGSTGIVKEEFLCSRCSRLSTNDNPVHLSINPYKHDIYGSEDMEYICSECYSDLIGDI